VVRRAVRRGDSARPPFSLTTHSLLRLNHADQSMTETIQSVEPTGVGRSARVRARIEVHQADFTRSEQAVADQLRRNGIELAFSPAATVSRQIGVSEATLVRFARTLGYDSYQHLQKDVQEEIRERLMSTSVSRFQRGTTAVSRRESAFSESLRRDLANLEATLEENSTQRVRAAVRALTTARTVWVLGLRASAGLATFLGHALRYLLPSVRLLSTAADTQFEELLDSAAGDVLVVVSLSRPAKRVAQLAQFARERGMQILLLTDNPVSRLTSLANICLVAESDSVAFIQSYTAATALAHALIAAIGSARPRLVEHRLGEMEQLFGRFELHESG
jgi:DNA-binding MurR/RpiR family transcriptional regulator